jgi:hypothetical protein
VNSGRSVSDSPPRSSKLYISLTRHRSSRRAAEHGGLFEHRHFRAAEAVQLAHAFEGLDHEGEGLGVGTENVLRAANGLGRLDLAHGPRD